MSTDRKFKSKLRREVGPLSFAHFMCVASNSMGLTQEDCGKMLGIGRTIFFDIEKYRQLVSTELAIEVVS